MITANRQMIFEQISEKRDEHYHLPGSEYDQLHSINDWIAITGQYLTRCADRKHTKSDIKFQRDSLLKAASVIVAAIEHLDNPMPKLPNKNGT